jgi:hypothetical protein
MTSGGPLTATFERVEIEVPRAALVEDGEGEGWPKHPPNGTVAAAQPSTECRCPGPSDLRRRDNRIISAQMTVMPSQNHFDVNALLKADHRKVEDMFAQFEAAKGTAKKQALVEKICAELSRHTVIEEEIFYPACRGKVDEGLLNEGYVEHDGSKRAK